MKTFASNVLVTVAAKTNTLLASGTRPWR